jgi:hypothetical protein
VTSTRGAPCPSFAIVRFFPPNTAMVTLSFAMGQGRMVLFLLLAGEGGAVRWMRGGSTDPTK